MEIPKLLFDTSWFEEYSTEAKLLYIYLSYYTEDRDTAYVTRERICFNTGISDSKLDSVLKELFVWFKYENNQLRHNRVLLNKKKKL